MRSSYLVFFLFILIASLQAVSAQTTKIKEIEDFKLIEESGKLKIVALTTNNEEIDEKVNGSFMFSISGIDVPLNFKDGEATVKQQFSGSTFAYFRSSNQSVSTIKLYYLQQISDYHWPVKIPISLLLIIPIVFFIIGYFVRKLIFLFIGILLAFFLFNKGLNLGSYFEVLWNWLI
ncbi:hypothetical protein NF867_01340 [Solitalea sp. MAHUQ-68]|uniref:Uncharacterized protein n=1 Tax=Solitalea agri TaxID=2953739 RepID=A0A9X2JC86_9SPHI|nr:hypothetical protein [Solitalea agri]MCO4291505.1 hypothetical protein [Solitalea agri]